MGKVENKMRSANSLLKYIARRKRGNEAAKLKRLKQPFAGTGMFKLGNYKIRKEQKVDKATKAKKSKKPIKIGQAEKNEKSAEVVEQNKEIAEVILEVGDQEPTAEALFCASDVSINL